MAPVVCLLVSLDRRTRIVQCLDPTLPTFRVEVSGSQYRENWITVSAGECGRLIYDYFHRVAK